MRTLSSVHCHWTSDFVSLSAEDTSTDIFFITGTLISGCVFRAKDRTDTHMKNTDMTATTWKIFFFLLTSFLGLFNKRKRAYLGTGRRVRLVKQRPNLGFEPLPSCERSVQVVVLVAKFSRNFFFVRFFGIDVQFI